nr:uncharacterized protein LOC110356439 [Columba livia]
MECPGVLHQLSILTAAVQLPFEKARPLGKTTQYKPTLAIKAHSVPIFILHSPALRDATKSNFTSHHSMMLLGSNMQHSQRALPTSHAQFLGEKSKETLVSCHLAAQVQTHGGGTTRSDRTCNPNCIQPGTDNFLRWKLLLTRGSSCHPRHYWRKLVTDQALLPQNHLQTALETICTQRTLTQVLIHRQLSTYPSLKCFLVQP